MYNQNTISMDYTKTQLETLVAVGAEEIFNFNDFRNIPEGWTNVGNYIAPNEEYGYPEIKARVLKGEKSGKFYIYWI